MIFDYRLIHKCYICCVQQKCAQPKNRIFPNSVEMQLSAAAAHVKRNLRVSALMNELDL